jgi:hypothetical protein
MGGIQRYRQASRYTKPVNETSYNHHIARLGRQIDRLEARDSRFTWYRVLAFTAGGLLTWGAFALAGSLWGWLVFGLAAAVFLGVVILHGQLRQRITCFQIWRNLAEEDLARLTLDWEHVPAPVWSPQGSRGPLATDLDLTGPHSLHHLLDVSLSRQGSALLAQWLCAGEPDLEAITVRQPLVRELARQRRFRLRLLLNYRRAQEAPLDGEALLDWLQTPFPAGRLRWLLPLASILVAFNLGLFLLSIFAGLPNYWVVTLVLYIGFYYFNGSTLDEFLEAVVRMDRELVRLRTLLTFIERYPLQDAPHLERLLASLREQETAPTRLVRRITWVTGLASVRMNPVLGLLANAVLPWDFAAAALAGHYRQALAERLPRWLEALYNLEALSGLGSFAALNPANTFPEIRFDATPVFFARRLGHPLLPSRLKICNDYQVNELGEIAIITGSNMAGKSTFLKTIGINLCLAYAGGPVDAASLSSMPFRLHTCMRISDSITDGFSYFYAEVRCLRTLLDRLAQDGLPLLYLIDEIFRGTNNRERLIGSRAYLQSLIGAAGIGFLATHDLELASLAERSRLVSNHHFREEVADGRLVFDYLIRPGPCPSTNALKIMAMEGLPVEVEEHEAGTTKLSE